MTLLHPAYFAPLRAMRVAAFDHVFTPITFTRIRQPNGEYEVVPQEGTVVRGKLTIASVRAAEVAAAQGIKAEYVAKLPLGTPAVEGQQFRVTGQTAGVAWTRTVAVTGDLGLLGKVNRRLAAVDVDLAP